MNSSNIVGHDVPNLIGKACKFLENLGLSISQQRLISLIDGVNASPLEIDDESWFALFDVSLSPDLCALLIALRKNRLKQNAKIKISSVDRLVKLRNRLTDMSIEGFILPRSDEHKSEYLPARAERLAWLTDFTGSAGCVVVLKKRAAVFTDGRYSLQIKQETNPDLYEAINTSSVTVVKWLERSLTRGQKIGYDPWLHTSDEVERLKAAAQVTDSMLIPVHENPIDYLWIDQPPAPLTPAVPHDIRFTGTSLTEKTAIISSLIKSDGQDAVILTSPESIAWLLNIRGNDVPRTPLSLSFAILKQDGIELFIDERKISNDLRKHLGNSVSIVPIAMLGTAIECLVKQDVVIRVDSATSPIWINNCVERAGGFPSQGVDPVILPKAIKNETELAGTRAAHLRDGLAFTRFLHWFSMNAPKGIVDEIVSADQLFKFRSEDLLFRDLSFDTISGSGPNGAIVHYRVTNQSNRILQMGDLYLVDSGAQYLDGTTDITRTLVVGDPSEEVRDRYTRVLKGHIAIALACFPEGTTGSQLDPLARVSLWEAGLDFDHGTGHGVGSYLGVHEGPQRISKVSNSVSLKPGMIISNEPGYYKEGFYGIRLENLIVVKEREIDGGDRKMLGFETITVAPFEKKLIDLALLTDAEINWVNSYHEWVYEKLNAGLDGEVAAWLADATVKIS